MVNMFDTCLDDTLQHLSDVEKHPRLCYDLARYENLKTFQAELRKYRMLLWCIPDAAVDAHLISDLNFIAAFISQLYKIDPETDSFALTDADEFNSLLDKFEEKSHKCSAEVSKIRYFQHLMSSCEAEAEPSCFTTSNNNYTIVVFLDSLHALFNDILKSTNQFESLVETLLFFRDLVCYTNPQPNSNFQSVVVHDWANKAASFSLLQGLYGIGTETRRRLHNDLQQIVHPCNPDFINFCFQVIKVPKMKPEDRLLFGVFVSRFIDFFLDNLMFILNDDDFPMVREGLIFLITFLADPPANALNLSPLIMPLVQEQIYSVLDQASEIMCVFCEANIDLSRRKTILDAFLKSIDEVREDIVNLYVHIPPLPWSDLPRINRLGFFECLLGYLENLKDTMDKNRKLVPFLKHQIILIHQELFLLDNWMVQNKHSELKDQIMSLLCQADFAIKSSFFIDNSIWYNLTFLSFVVRKIKDIRPEVKNIEFETQTQGSDICKPFMSSIDVHKPSSSTSTVEAVVGFEKETELLIDRLKWGSEQLDIVSIVGMGGIGKTTLAKKLYNEPSIKHHFHKRAFCSVSQVYSKRNVLLGILSDLSLNGGEIHQTSDEDLAHRLRKSLKGFRYLIVVDDIWDINVWDDLRHSFPDDRIGSRVIFTTRINSISLTAKPDSTPCSLSFLSEDESWELLQHKVFHKDPCPPHLLDVGKLIAEKCKGLPLAIVVIAGLLSKTEKSLPQWNEVAVDLSSFASSQGCKDIIKLSYKHLPEALKSCFLYLGAFREDKVLSAIDLTLLWVSEGFVLKSGNRCLHKIAETYLDDLVDWNLVTVTDRLHNGRIEWFCVHDLIRDFCRTEAREEHFMCYINADNQNFLLSSLSYHYRISIDGEWRSYADENLKGLTTVCSLRYVSSSFDSYIQDHVTVNSLQSFLCNFKLVQLLDLFEIIIDGEFPIMVTTLIHLRYLALQFYDILIVPPDISNLWNLETLLLWVYGSSTKRLMVAFPNDIWKMKRLRNVEALDWASVALGDETEVGFQLPDLQTFHELYIPPGEEGEELLRRLPNVRTFSCYFKRTQQLPKLEILTKLESLSMTGDGVVQPPYMFSFPPTINTLTLQNLNLPWNELSAIIGMLPCLEVLELNQDSFSGKRWDVEDDEFPNIKSLSIEYLDIKEWNASKDSFPSLEKLVVCRCSKLMEIPLCFSEVATLKYIEVRGCKKTVADSAIEIQKGQFDWGNESFEVEVSEIEA